MRRVILIIATVLALVILAATPTALSMVQRTDAAPAPAPITEHSTDPSVGPIHLPEVSDDPYYRPGDMFEVTQSGDLFMVGTNNAIQSDVDWLILEHTKLPIGLYVLDNKGRLIGTH